MVTKAWMKREKEGEELDLAYYRWGSFIGEIRIWWGDILW